MIRRKFTYAPRCPICLRDDIGLKCESEHVSTGDNTKFLTCKCYTCSYVWRMDSAGEHDEENLPRKAMIRHEANLLRKRIIEGSSSDQKLNTYLYGEPIDPEDDDMLLLAAYYLGSERESFG